MNFDIMDTFTERVYAVDMNGRKQAASNQYIATPVKIKELGYGR